MANQPVEVEIREPGQPSGKPRGGLSPEQIYAVGDQQQANNKPWLQRNAYLLCFLFGWILFPLWWGAAIYGIKQRKSLKGSEKAAWYGCVALSLAGIIIFLIFIIWYGADPQGARKALTSFYTWDDSTPSSSTDSSITVAKYTLKYKGACSDATYDALLTSVKSTIMTGTEVDENLLVVKGDPCTSKDSTTGRHLLELVSTYQILAKVKAAASDEFKIAFAGFIKSLATGGNNPNWCGPFCTDHAADIVGIGAEEFGFKACNVAAADGKAYTCTSGTLLGDNIALDGKVSDAVCCSNCESFCTKDAVRPNVTLAANQEPTFEFCCNPCYNLTCELGAISPPPTLDVLTQAVEELCCVQAPVEAPTVTMTLGLPNCNDSSASALASGTQNQMTQEQDPEAASTLSVKAECVADETTTTSTRRLTDDEAPKNKVKLIITIEGPKTPAEMKEATKVFVKAFGFDVPDNATADDLAAQLQSLSAPDTTVALTTLVSKVSAAVEAAGIPVVVDVDAIKQSITAVKAPCLCPGLPSAANVAFPPSCSNSKIGETCPGSCKVGVGMKASVCGSDGLWKAPTGDCSTTATKKDCTEAPAAALNATWPSTNCTGQSSCKAVCDIGFSGQPTATCDPLTGAWSKPVGDCRPVKCPALKDDATTTWPKSCLFNRKDFECKATCQTGSYGTAPKAHCTIEASGNSAAWNISSAYTPDGCYAPTTCDSFNASGVICDGVNSILMINKTCVDPRANSEDETMPECTVKECCRMPKVCRGQDIECPVHQRLYKTQTCEDNNTPACDAERCCVPDRKCKDTEYLTCPAHKLSLGETPCGEGADGACSEETCCKAMPQFPANATCNDLDGNMTAFTDDDCGVGRKVNASAANVTVFELILQEAVPVCCRDIPVLELTQTSSPKALLMGSHFNLTITVKNAGHQDAANVTVTEELPEGMTFNSTAPNGCNITGSRMVCGPIDSLAAQADGVSYTVLVFNQVAAAGTFEATAEARGTGAADGYAYSAPEGGVSLLVQQTCAHHTPRTGAAFACPTKYTSKAGAEGFIVSGAPETVARDQCCTPLCSTHTCSTDSVALKTTANDIACIDGKCSDAVCCSPACSTYENCKNENWAINLQAVGNVCPDGGCDDATCCQETCASHQCSTGWTAAHEDPWSIPCSGAACNDTTCCAKSCAAYTCNSTSLVRLGNAESTPCTGNLCDDKTCCVDPGTCASYACTASNYLAPDINEAIVFYPKPCNGTQCNADLCCAKSCALWPCTGQYKNMTDSQKLSCGVNECNNDACCIKRMPDLVASQSITPASILIGANFTMNITVDNVGDYMADGATATVELPANLKYVQGPTGCQAVGQTLTCSAASIAVNNRAQFELTIKAIKVGTYRVSVKAGAADDRNAANDESPASVITVGSTCQHSTSDGEAFPCGDKWSFNNATANSTDANLTTCCIEKFPDIALSQAVSPENGVLIGDDVTITVTLDNRGDYKATNATVTHTLSAGLKFQDSSAGCAPAVNESRTVTCTISSVAAGKNGSYTLTAKATEKGTQQVQSSVVADGDNNSKNDVATEVQIIVDWTCKQYTVDKSEFKCSPSTEFAFNKTQANFTGPDRDNCCYQLHPDLTISEETLPANGLVTLVTMSLS